MRSILSFVKSCLRLDIRRGFIGWVNSFVSHQLSTKSEDSVREQDDSSKCIPQPNDSSNPRFTNEKFRKLSQAVSLWAGSPAAFALAMALVGVWATLGPVFKYSDTWQLVINTGTTIITFLMVFLIQNSQNRESKVIQIKIDELIRATKRARNELLDLGDLADSELDRLHKEFAALHAHADSQMEAIKKHRVSIGSQR